MTINMNKINNNMIDSQILLLGQIYLLFWTLWENLTFGKMFVW